MKDERQPLRRGQGVEHDQEREADGVGEQRLLLRLELAISNDDRVGQMHPEELLVARVA